MNINSESWWPNVLGDGVEIERLPCAISIRCIVEGEFQPSNFSDAAGHPAVRP
jgi:hypothetical protein